MEADLGRCGLKFKSVGGVWRVFSRRTSLSMRVQGGYVRDLFRLGYVKSIVGLHERSSLQLYLFRAGCKMPGASASACFRQVLCLWKTVLA